MTLEHIDIDDLFIRYGTDKGGPWGWGYSSAYQHHLEPVRESARNVLEIGICGHRDIPNNVVGASLFAWRDFFPHAQVYGLDNDERFIFNDKPRITTRLTNAYDVGDLGAALKEFNKMLDFVCDDAVHDPDPQIELCAQIWPFVETGGIYAIEDVCPYKLPGSDLRLMKKQLVDRCPGMSILEYATHKAERLLVCTKAKS
jgi:hypothetical protein